MGVARLFGDLSVGQPARGLEIRQGDQRLEERGAHPRPLARHFPLQQGGDSAQCGVDAGGTVRDGDPGPNRALAGQAGDRHQPAHALDDLVHRGAFDVRSVLAEAGDADNDEARIDGVQPVEVDLQPVLDQRTEILEEHVGSFHEPVEDLESLGVLQVERKASFAPVEILEVRSVPQPGQALPLGVLDHHHVGAPVSEVTHRRRPRPRLRQVEHAKRDSGNSVSLLCPVSAVIGPGRQVDAFPRMRRDLPADRRWPDRPGSGVQGRRRGPTGAQHGRPPLWRQGD